MNDTLNAGILLENALHTLQVAAVDLLESGTLTRNLLNTIDDLLVGVREVVNNHYLVTCFLQFNRGMATNKACTTSYKNRLFHYCMYL